jgi:sigma-B regulation protein RsbU (phosphoserine phosphatase)
LGVSTDDIHAVRQHMEVVRVRPGQQVFAEGDLGDGMHVIASGAVHFQRRSSTVRTLGPGEFFGEMSLFDPKALRVASAKAVEHTTLLRLGRDSFLELTRERPDLMVGMLREFARRMNRHAKEIDSLRHLLQEVILPVGIALSTERHIERLLERIILVAKQLCRADGGTIYLISDAFLHFSVMSCDSLGIAVGGTSSEPVNVPPLRLINEDGSPNLTNVASYVAHKGESMNLPDVYEASEFDFSGTRAFDQAQSYRTKSVLTTPLKDHEGRVIGVMQLINATDEDGQVIAFGPFQHILVESLASQASVALNIQNLLERQRELLKVEHDVEVGRQIQSDFLPEALPQPQNWEVDGRFRPALQVAGDFYDAFPVKSGQIAFVIADVCDKGVGAALFMALSRSLIRAFSWLENSTHRLEGAHTEPITLANDYITRFHGKMNMFVTLAFGLLDPETGTLRYINAGHCPPIVVGADGTIKHRLMPTGPAVGVIPDIVFKTSEVVLAPGDILLAFTDGVTEARGPQGAFFTEKRLFGVVKESVPTTAAGLLDRIDEALHAHVAGAAPSDDITMMAIRRLEP